MTGAVAPIAARIEDPCSIAAVMKNKTRPAVAAFGAVFRISSKTSAALMVYPFVCVLT